MVDFSRDADERPEMQVAGGLFAMVRKPIERMTREERSQLASALHGLLCNLLGCEEEGTEFLLLFRSPDGNTTSVAEIEHKDIPRTLRLSAVSAERVLREMGVEPNPDTDPDGVEVTRG